LLADGAVADRALYLAKERGLNRVEAYDKRAGAFPD
jgi:hypothetical protein